jgi:subfamily B ATP-binding cassette protein MsbA
MSEPERRQNYRNILRFYRMALRYWKLIVLSLIAMFVYSGVSFNAVLLLKPFVTTFQGPKGEAPAVRAASEEAKAPALAGKDRLRDWFLGLPFVRSVVQWLWGKLSLKRVAFVIAFIIGPLFVVSGFLQDYLEGRVVWSVLADARMAVFGRLTTLSLRYYSRQRTGELLSRLTIDVARSESAMKILFGKIILQPIMLVFFLAGALWSSVYLSLLVLVVTPVLVVVVWYFGRTLRRQARKTLERLADLTDSVSQMLNGIRVVKSFNMEQAEVESFRVRNQAQLKRAFKLVKNDVLANVVPQALLGIGSTALLLLVADHLLRAGRLTLADTLVCAAFLGLAESRVRRVVKAYTDLQQSMASVNRIFELIDTRPDIEDRPDAVSLDGVREGVRFSDAWFSYGEEPVLRGIDLFVPAGKTYAIVGETGAGKSTMLDMIPRFYDVQRGAVSIDGVDVRHIRRSSLMKLIAVVGQHPFLFNRPIAENIRYGKPDATDEEVHAAAAGANIHNFILSLPGGYETMAGEAGDRFSGGQRQCITIARAILKNAPILILDEATSSLDAQSEMLVQQALDGLMENRTTLVIAHRLSTVRNADCIVVLRGGRIVEQGTHEELLRKEGEYCRLYQLQFAHAAGERPRPDREGAP